MVNYMRFRLQNVKPVMRKGVVPHRFDYCQRNAPAVIPPSRDRGVKRKRKQLVAELLGTSSAPSTSTPSSSTPSTSSAFTDGDVEDVPPERQFRSRAVQVNMKMKRKTKRSKATMTAPAAVDTCGTSTEDLVGRAVAATQTRVEDFPSF